MYYYIDTIIKIYIYIYTQFYLILISVQQDIWSTVLLYKDLKDTVSPTASSTVTIPDSDW